MRAFRKKILGSVTTAFLVVGVTSIPSEASAADWFNCQANDLFEYDNSGTPLLMVECSNTYITGVNWTAIQLSSYSDAKAQRFTAMASAAILSQRPFRVFMTDSVCPNNSNCRLASAWAFYKP
jgi:hypothetical protein